MGRFVAMMGLLVLLLGSGCVRVEEERKPFAENRLWAVTRVDRYNRFYKVIQWESDPKLAYTITYRDRRRRNSRAQVLPGAAKLIGTGGLMQVEDRSSDAPHRVYNSVTEVLRSAVSP